MICWMCTCHFHIDPTFDNVSSAQKKFLAWQSNQFFDVCINIVIFLAFDLLRVDFYGFKQFCKYFLEKYPGYFISPLRVSGSAVESLFSQLKYNAGGKLDSVNYATARASCLIKQTTSTLNPLQWKRLSRWEYRHCGFATNKESV